MSGLIGRRIDSYQIDALLGVGGMGTVYRAHDVNLDKPVALKVMHEHLARQSEFQRRFLDEARSAARLSSHPSIVNIHRFDQSQGQLYMVMEYFPAGSLTKYIKQLANTGQALELRETLAILAQVADALDYAHRQGVVHRDVKPDNVLLQRLDNSEREGDLPIRAVVTDFGLAKLVSGDVKTQTGMVLGSINYMSPEQFRGRGLDGRSDLYSLGIVLFQLATGRLPFDIESIGDAAEKHMREVPPQPIALRPGLPSSVSNLITKSIAKNPEERFQTGEEMARALRQAANGLTAADVTYFAAQAPVMSLVTQLRSLPPAAEPTDIGEHFGPAKGDQLIVSRQGVAARTYPLSKNTVTIGRSSTNDIQLDEVSISRQQARLERAADGWQITDLGSANGTFLEGSQLLTDVPEEWQPGQICHMGPFQLRLQMGQGGSIQRAMPLAGTIQATRQRSGASLGGTQIYSGSGRLGVVVQPLNVDVAPGQRADVQVDLLNQGAIVDHFSLEIENLPADWVTLPAEPVHLLPTTNTSLPFSIHPPLKSDSTSGRHHYRLRVKATTNEADTVVASGTVNVLPFTRFSTDMHPTRLRHGGRGRVMIQNQSNHEAEFHIAGRDPANEIEFGATRRLRLGAGQQGTETFAPPTQAPGLYWAHGIEAF